MGSIGSFLLGLLIGFAGGVGFVLFLGWGLEHFK